LWVHCQGGYRASAAASFLDAADRTVVAIDDDFDRAASVGLPLVPAPRESTRGQRS
jgi:rhodanese-related sulfurtransferase